MNKLNQNKNKNQPVSHSVKKQKPKPEWTTDFVDRQQYKLSQVQRIQKKASLQSKNREQARRQLQQRRKKLQMGIIDEQTKKIYQTALISKNIDINPSLRRNLTEMIRYEKQQRQRNMQENYNYNEQNEEDFDEDEQTINQLKQAQNFIKKFEKAKKQQKIQRAVQILSNNPPSNYQRPNNQAPQTKTNNFLKEYNESNTTKNRLSSYDEKKSSKSDALSQDDAISSIQDTIRFMQEKLFNAKRTVDEHSKSFISQPNESVDYGRKTNYELQQRQTGTSTKMNFKKPQKNDKKYTELRSGPYQNAIGSNQELEFGTKIGEISQLKINFKDQNDNQSDDECLETIRRMRELLDNQESQQKENKEIKFIAQNNFMASGLANLASNSNFSKRTQQSGIDSEAEVSFSLTMNEDEFQPELSRLSRNEFMDRKPQLQQDVFMLKPSMKKENQNFKKAIQQNEYQNEYRNVKQNLFACINSQEPQVLKENKQPNITRFKPVGSNFEMDSQEQESSQDSLMVQNKINMWKKEFERQIDPDEEDEDDEPYKHNFMSKEVEHRQKQQNSKYSDQGNTKQPQQQIVIKAATIPNKKPPLNSKKVQSFNDNKFEQMKKMISNVSTQVRRLEIEPLKIETLGGNQVMGFDFRGSLNIKKNINK